MYGGTKCVMEVTLGGPELKIMIDEYLAKWPVTSENGWPFDDVGWPQ